MINLQSAITSGWSIFGHCDIIIVREVGDHKRPIRLSVVLLSLSLLETSTNSLEFPIFPMFLCSVRQILRSINFTNTAKCI